MPKETHFPVRKMISISEEMDKELDDYRWEQRIGSESEAIRRVLGLGLEAIKQQKALLDKPSTKSRAKK